MESTRHSRSQGKKGPNIPLKVEWIDGEKSWVGLDVIKYHAPKRVLEYVLKNNLVKSPGWEWVHQFLQAHEGLAPYRKAYLASKKEVKYKFGVKVAMSPKHALELDLKKGNNLWKEAIQAELDQINEYKTFRVLENNEPTPTGFKRIPYHFVFDVKIDGQRKARLVAGGHRTEPPKEDTYSGVVSLEAVRMGFILAQLLGLLVCAGGVGNAFLYGRTREKVFVIAGPEFGPKLVGKRMIIFKSLYGLKTSSARFHEHLSEKLRQIGYTPSKAYLDLWILKKCDHYEFIARFVDDVLIFSRDPLSIMNELKKTYVMKAIGTPEYYLGGNVVQLGEEWEREGITTALSAKIYITNIVDKLAKMVGIDKFPKSRYKTPMSDDYHSELDQTNLCTPVEASKYRSLIGSANWIVALGRFDIAYATSTLARYSSMPRQGHYKAAQRIFGYSRKYSNGKVLIDVNQAPIRGMVKIDIDQSWTELYPEAEAIIPYDMLEPLGKQCSITCYVDADHARDKVTCRSVTGILLLVNNTPLIWYTKCQKTVESSTYGSELVTARIGVEMVIEGRYKLRMLGTPLEKTSLMVGDNMSVVINTTIHSSMLKKKHNAIAYHRVRETVASRTVNFAHVPSTANVADVLTKPLNSDIFHRLMKEYLFRRPKTVCNQVDTYVAGLAQRVNDSRKHDCTNVILDERPEGTPTLAVIDGGSNRCLMGVEFHYEVIDITRQVCLEGFSGPSSHVRYNMGVGVTMVQTTEDLILIRIHEGVVTDQRSILSTTRLGQLDK